MSEPLEVSCTACGFDRFKEFEYEPARPESKFLWFKRAAHEARIKITCALCGHIQYVKPGEIQVTSHVVHNFVTGRTTRIK